MSGETPRFGLNYFDDGTLRPGALSDDGCKFTGADRLFLDQVLHALEVHDHTIAPSGDWTPSAPTNLTPTSGGSLAAGTDLYYRISLVDYAGLESVAGPEAHVVMPTALPAPDAPSVDTDAGGTLQPGIYQYAVQSYRTTSGGLETSAASDVVVATILSSGTDDSVILTPPAAAGDEAGWYVWRNWDGDGIWKKFATAIPLTGEWLDDGSTSPDEGSLPVRGGGGTYAVSLELASADAVELASTYRSWRIYRTTTSGTYGGNSLVHEVSERTDDLDPDSPVYTSWVDLGDALTPGRPGTVDRGLDISRLTIPIHTTLPTASLYPEGYPLILNTSGTLSLKINLSSTWTDAGGSGGSGGMSVGETRSWRLVADPKYPPSSGWSFYNPDGSPGVYYGKPLYAGDEVNEVTFALGAGPGTYTATYICLSTPDSGMIDFYLDGTLIDSAYNLYTASEDTVLRKKTGLTVSSSGPVEFMASANGKDPSSTGYGFYLGELHLTRTA